MFTAIILAVSLVCLLILLGDDLQKRRICKKHIKSSPTTNNKTKQINKEIDMSKKHRSSRNTSIVHASSDKKTVALVKEVKELTSNDAFEILTSASKRTTQDINVYEIVYILIDALLDDLINYAEKQKTNKEE